MAQVYRVQHSMVGDAVADEFVTFHAIVDVDRLEKMGAIRKATLDEQANLQAQAEEKAKKKARDEGHEDEVGEVGEIARQENGLGTQNAITAAKQSSPDELAEKQGAAIGREIAKAQATTASKTAKNAPDTSSAPAVLMPDGTTSPVA